MTPQLRRNALSALFIVLALMLTASIAYANPIENFMNQFDSFLTLATTRIIPGLAIVIIAWNGIAVATGRKQLMDCVGTFLGCALALGASVLVGYLSA